MTPHFSNNNTALCNRVNRVTVNLTYTCTLKHGQRCKGTTVYQKIFDNAVIVMFKSTSQSPPRVFALHKPRGMKCDLSVNAQPNTKRPKDMKTWFDSLCPNLRHVGRLDKATTGLLLATTATKEGGEFTTRLLTPGNVEKTYIATCRIKNESGSITDEQMDALLQNVELSDGPAKFTKVSIIDKRTTVFKKFTKHEIDVKVTLRIGRNRIVRRLLAAHGMPVCYLHRISIGSLDIKELQIPNTSDSVELNENQIDLLWLSNDNDDDSDVKARNKDRLVGLKRALNSKEMEAGNEKRSKK